MYYCRSALKARDPTLSEEARALMGAAWDAGAVDYRYELPG